MAPEMVFVVNPAAGRGSGAREWRRLAARLNAAGVSYHVSFTAGPGDATILARRALEDGSRIVVAVGGDGTAHEVVNGIFAQGRLVTPDAQVAFVAAGTGNDVGRQFQLRDPAHLGDRTTRVDILRLSYSQKENDPAERYALFHAGVGLAAEAVEMSNRLKGKLGWLAYAGGTAVALYRHQPHQVRFSWDDGPIVTRDVNFIFAANGKYAGGGMLVAPMASMDDGIVDVITLEGASRSDMMFRLLPSIYRGAHIGHAAVGHFRAHTLHLASDEPLTVQADGELAGTTPVWIDVLPQALPVCV
jgi:diacylglycerol kinase (ATP)